MGSSKSKAQPDSVRVIMSFFPSLEALLHNVNKIGPQVEKSENRMAKMCWSQLKMGVEQQISSKKALQEEWQQILKDEEEENGKEAAEQLHKDVTSGNGEVPMSLIEKCSLRIQSHLFQAATLEKCFIKLQEDFGFIETVITNEMIEKMKKKVEEMDWDELAELENIMDPPPGRTVTVTDAKGTLTITPIPLDGIQ
ncbi:unnamed protein product [Caenorhabditis nigoni]